MKYLNTLISDVGKNLIPISAKDSVLEIKDALHPCSGSKICGIDEIFKDCEELKNKKYLNVTKLKEKLAIDLTEKGKKDYEVYCVISYLFIPYTKFLYTTIELNFNNFELVEELFNDGLFENPRYYKYICNYAIDMINNDFKMKDEIKIDQKPWNYVTIKCDCDINTLNLRTTYTTEKNISSQLFPIVVAKKNIVRCLNKNIEKAYNLFKINENIDNNKMLLDLKRKYIDYLNIDSLEVSWWYDGTKNKDYEMLCELLDVNTMNEEYMSKLKVYEDLVTTEVNQKNILLADTLNTIQIASIVLTIVGWALVILQHDLPSRVPIYIIAILLCSLVSISIAIAVKKVIDKKK